MAKETKNIGLYLEDDGTTKFQKWRDKINGPIDSNMVKIDDEFAKKQDKLTGAAGQVVGFDADGEPVAQDAASLVGSVGADGKSAYEYAVDGGYTGSEEEFMSLLGSGPWLPLFGGQMAGTLYGAASGSGSRVTIVPGELEINGGSEATLYVNQSYIGTLSACISFAAQQIKIGGGIGSASRNPIRISNVDAPVEDNDAATKEYVDAVLNSGLATKAEVDAIRSLLAAHLDKIATLEWKNSTTGAHSVNIRMFPYLQAGLKEYTFTYRGQIDAVGTNTEVVLIPPPGYAFTNLVSTFVPKMVFDDGKVVVGRSASDGSITFTLGGANGYFSFANSDNYITNYDAIVCLEVA